MSVRDPRAIYKPFVYPWAFEAWLKQNQAHWMATEVPMSDDVTDFREKLPAPEKNLITQTLRFFTQGDVEVGNNYMTRLGPVFPVPEINMMLSAFANTEGIHVHAYSYLIDTLGLPETEYSAFLNYKAMRDKYEYLANFSTRSDYDIAKTLAVFGGFMEGTALFASFAILKNFEYTQGLMRGVGQIISWSIRDESLHADSICHLYRTFLAENPEVQTMKLEHDVRMACVKMVEMEDHFVDTCFEMGAVRGISPDDVKQYVRFIADRRLNDLMLEPEFKVSENPLPWVAATVNGKEHVNFFEQRATDYAKGVVDESWPK